MQFCMYNCILLVSGLGARLIVGSRMTTGELTSMIIYAVQILSSLMMLSMVFVMVIMARSSAERIVDAEALMLPEGYDTMLTGDHESLIKEMRDGGRAGRWQGLLCQTAFHVLTFHGEYRYNFSVLDSAQRESGKRRKSMKKKLSLLLCAALAANHPGRLQEEHRAVLPGQMPA